MNYSKNKEKFTVNGNEYRTKKWNVITTLKEGNKLLKAIGPVFTSIIDVKSAKPEKSLDEIIEGSNVEYLLTGAFSMLADHFTDEHFEDLIDKLLSGLEVKVLDKDGNLADDWVTLDDWNEHFGEYQEDVEGALTQSIKVNLYDFFIKQPTVRTTLDKVLAVMAPVVKTLEDSMSEDSTNK